MGRSFVDVTFCAFFVVRFKVEVQDPSPRFWILKDEYFQMVGDNLKIWAANVSSLVPY